MDADSAVEKLDRRGGELATLLSVSAPRRSLQRRSSSLILFEPVLDIIVLLFSGFSKMQGAQFRLNLPDPCGGSALLKLISDTSFNLFCLNLIPVLWMPQIDTCPQTMA
ncbi:MAG: hypothetical protein CME10_15380 [Gemmatimonadetes bacterium]|nr:hypothetical protein [Gemmatimonadota bacterium]